jgi:hypothetical protein
MTYQTIRTCAFTPAGSEVPFTADFYALAFPAGWRQILLELFRHGRRNPQTIRSVPVRRFRELLHAVTPELIALNRAADPDDNDPILYCERPFPPGVIQAVVAAWAADLPVGEDKAGILRGATAQLLTGDLAWNRVPVDMLQQTISDGGTAAPDAKLYALLPELLARRIAASSQYTFEGTRLTFVQAPPTMRGAAELVSWPPRTFTTGRREWHFSFYIRISLQTVPFDPRPRIHLHTGVRRWESHRRLYIPPGDRASVYLAADAPWLAGAPEPTSLRFGLGHLKWRPSGNAVDWSEGGPEGMLERLIFAADFPSPKQLSEDPTSWLGGINGVTAAVLYSTAMGKHGVGAGHMPRDRAPLLEWAGQALAPEFVPVPDFRRSKLPTKPKSSAATRKTSASVGEAELGQIMESDPAIARRAQIASVLGDRNFVVDVFHQTGQIRDALIGSAVSDLGLSGAGEIAGEPKIRQWQTGELDIELRLHELSDLGAGLKVDGKVPANRDQWDTAIADRRRDVMRRVGTLQPGSCLALTEIGRPDDFKGTWTDPKVAMRLGFADADLVSQFVHPADDSKAEDATVEHRALAAWRDGLRQVGLASLPAHSLGDRIPGDLTYLAFWIIRRNKSGPTHRAQVLPVAVLMRPGVPYPLGISPGATDWLPYSEFLCRLAQDGTPDSSWSREEDQAATGRFFRHVLQTIRHRPSLLLTYAQNTRGSWPWLANSQSIPDLIGFGDQRHRAALFGEELRHVRVRDGESFETTQWFAPNDDAGTHGLAEGLWLPADAAEGNRVFGSTTAKPDTAKTAAVSASKLVARLNSSRIDTGKNAWNPGLLEIAVLVCRAGDDPEAWAALTHQLRISPDHRNALRLPLPLHLAMQTSEYVLHAEHREVGE